jgi:hypothetical protein
MTAFAMRRNEIRLAADFLARAEAWVEQAAPELQTDIARIRARLLLRADRLMDGPVAGVRPTLGEEARESAADTGRGPSHPGLSVEADNNSTPPRAVGLRLRGNARSQPRWRNGPERRRPATFSR